MATFNDLNLYSEPTGFGKKSFGRKTAFGKFSESRTILLKNNDPLDAALFYLALNKKPLVCSLFKTVKDTRMYKFFQNDFLIFEWVLKG